MKVTTSIMGEAPWDKGQKGEYITLSCRWGPVGQGQFWSVGLQPNDNVVRMWASEQDDEPNLHLPANWTIGYQYLTRSAGVTG